MMTAFVLVSLVLPVALLVYLATRRDEEEPAPAAAVVIEPERPALSWRQMTAGRDRVAGVLAAHRVDGCAITTTDGRRFDVNSPMGSEAARAAGFADEFRLALGDPGAVVVIDGCEVTR